MFGQIKEALNNEKLNNGGALELNYNFLIILKLKHAEVLIVPQNFC